jgi:hypothetical protein
LGFVTVLSSGASSRFTLNSEYSAIFEETVMPLRSNGYCFYSFNDGYTNVDKNIGTDCYLGTMNKAASTLLFGDSFAGHNEPFFDELFKANDASFQSIVTNWCTPSLTKRFTGPTTHLSYQQCLLNRAFLNENIHNYKNIIFAADWDNVLKVEQFEDLEDLIRKAASLNLNVFIMAAPYRYDKSPLSDFYRSAYFGDQFINTDSGDNDALIRQAHTRLKELSEQYSNVHFIDRDLLYTENNTYMLGSTIVPYSLDGRHISMLGSKNSAKYFMQQPQYDEMMNNFDLK